MDMKISSNVRSFINCESVNIMVHTYIMLSEIDSISVEKKTTFQTVFIPKCCVYYAGHDTTQSAMSFILMTLAQHPDIQDKCRAEIDAILLSRDTDQIQ